jgi:predicted dehydrogenase
MDLSVHDVDFVRWILNFDNPLEVYATGSSSQPELAECNVLDNATMHIKFAGGAVCTIMMSRGSTYGYDQRCTVFGDKGIASINSSNKTSLVVGNASGMHSDTLQHSFPQCFREAFEKEIEVFVDVVVGNTSWPISEGDCVVAQAIAMAAKASCVTNALVPFDAFKKRFCRSTSNMDKITVRPVGNGSFGRYIYGLLGNNAAKFQDMELLEPYSRSSALSYENDVLKDGSVDAVYICSPDAVHHTQAIECFTKGKHVLVEKPVYAYEHVVFMANSISALLTPHCPLVVMIGFQRRFADEFIRARDYVHHRIANQEAIRFVEIESRDPVDAVADLSFVLKNSMCHDIDLLSWIFPSDTTQGDFKTAVKFTSCVTDVNTSLIELHGVVNVETTMATQTIPLKITYSKAHYSSYVQKINIDGESFGYDYLAPEGEPFCAVYADAYQKQWRLFIDQVKVAMTWAKGDGGGWKGSSEEVEVAMRMASYAKTFKALEDADKLLSEHMRSTV